MINFAAQQAANAAANAAIDSVNYIGVGGIDVRHHHHHDIIQQLGYGIFNKFPGDGSESLVDRVTPD